MSSRSTFGKRQKEQARKEKQRAKAERKLERKREKQQTNAAPVQQISPTPE
jgi:hypothetical protein